MSLITHFVVNPGVKVCKPVLSVIAYSGNFATSNLRKGTVHRITFTISFVSSPTSYPLHHAVLIILKILVDINNRHTFLSHINSIFPRRGISYRLRHRMDESSTRKTWNSTSNSPHKGLETKGTIRSSFQEARTSLWR